MKTSSIALHDYLKLTYMAGGHPLTQVFSQRIGAIIAWLCQNAGLTPNQTTALAGICITTGAWAYAAWPANLTSFLLVLILLQLAYATDCADGQLARATGRTSAQGAWWDVFVDFYAINLLSFAILRYLLEHPINTSLMVGGVMLFTIGRNLSLYSSTMARKSGHDADAISSIGVFRFLFRLIIDTSFLLLCVAILRNYPLLLVFYLYTISFFLILHSLYVGLRYTHSE